METVNNVDQGGSSSAPASAIARPGSLAQALERWLALEPPAPMTARAYRYAIARLEAHGLVGPDDVTPASLSRYVDARAKTSPGALHVDLAALASTLGHLERRGDFSAARLAALKRVHRPSRTRRRQLTARFLDEHERLALLEGAQATSRRALLVVRFGLFSGLRFGELRRARWSEIELGEKPHLDVRWVPELGQAGRIKTYQERRVPVCKPLKLVLEAARPGDGKGFVFPRNARDVTELATERALRAELRAAAELAGLEDVSFPLLRHTRASTWLQSGVPAEKCAFWLGHSLQVFLEYYGAIAQGYDPDCEADARAG